MRPHSLAARLLRACRDILVGSALAAAVVGAALLMADFWR
jgi:hypothetical protein